MQQMNIITSVPRQPRIVIAPVRKAVRCRNSEKAVRRAGREALKRILKGILWVAPMNGTGCKRTRNAQRSSEIGESPKDDAIHLAAISEIMLSAGVAAIVLSLIVGLVCLL